MTERKITELRDVGARKPAERPLASRVAMAIDVRSYTFRASSSCFARKYREKWYAAIATSPTGNRTDSLSINVGKTVSVALRPLKDHFLRMACREAPTLKCVYSASPACCASYGR